MHDVAGNLTRKKMTAGTRAREWIHTSNPRGQVLTVDGPRTDLTVVTAYDAAAALVAVEDGLNNSIEYELDVYGNRVQEAVFDPQGLLRRTMGRVYDAANRLERELGATGQTTSYAYDANRNLTAASDPLNRVTTNTYDALNRLTNVSDPANGNTVFTYDAKDRLKTVKDPKLTATTTYNYNGLGDLESQVSPDTGTRPSPTTRPATSPRRPMRAVSSRPTATTR